MSGGVKDQTTIYALSSGGLPSGVAVARMSGPGTRTALDRLVGGAPEPRYASLRTIRHVDGTPIDRGLILYFPGPASFTGEDCAEFQIHGGRSVVAALFSALSALDGFQAAEPGEFIRRAFENGRMDLTEVEGLGDLIAAETEMQRRLALEHAEGGLATLYNAWSTRLTECRAHIEAGLDFSDEEDVPDDIASALSVEIGTLAEEILQHLRGVRAGEIVRQGFRVVLAGLPNAGKSSLMNALAGRDVSIVSHQPGTTRDIVTVTLDLAGYAVVVQDTAGLRETTEDVEAEGVRRAEAAMRDADLVLHLYDLSTGARPHMDTALPVLKVGTKCDLPHAVEPDRGDLAISTRTGAGLDVLLCHLEDHVANAAMRSGDVIPSRARHREHLERTLAALNAAAEHDGSDPELVAEHLREAAFALGRITGRVDVEDLLDVVFGSFCIGK
ncbi:tRNA uridine-5-carboxymethylaminomethyl(34) synthesis GTPase MnmE [Pararhizobium mangrovi]|uniref:tRNA modification GTPase MnmE n=1 Tax=Pararhizobium mangrovi TaxID=2590452 RepID=A0A506U3Z6_9HYPH|nr:tRNA uridine-5-carboxymethylaminomethyl(34) synthesis GTPase MnmE [Pararhizobium mangrovi]TPW27269.1 tRNA uridine-5-carboxymethylaminomethyl(34) synthesis GTPase MnmE [Pararhizobium mangrovi]